MDGRCDVFLRSLFINPIIWANWTMSQFLAPERTPSNRFNENQSPWPLSHGHNFHLGYLVPFALAFSLSAPMIFSQVLSPTGSLRVYPDSLLLHQPLDPYVLLCHCPSVSMNVFVA